MKIIQIGSSSQGLPISAFQLGSGPVKLVIVAGMHGDEIEGIHLAHTLIRELYLDLTDDACSHSLVVIPVLNPDGFSRARRWTATGVDLNRNFPSLDWTPIAHSDRYPPGKTAGSEPETKSLVTFLEQASPYLVFDLHSYRESVLMPTWSGKEMLLSPLVTSLASSVGVRIEEDSLGYPVHGGLHTWCQERGIAHFTFEVLRDSSQKSIEDVYLGPSLAFTKFAVEKIPVPAND